MIHSGENYTMPQCLTQSDDHFMAVNMILIQNNNVGYDGYFWYVLIRSFDSIIKINIQIISSYLYINT